MTRKKNIKGSVTFIFRETNLKQLHTNICGCVQPRGKVTKVKKMRVKGKKKSPEREKRKSTQMGQRTEASRASLIASPMAALTDQRANAN